jgi:predicted ABC-class ATPase
MRDRKEVSEIIRRIEGGDFAEYAQIVGDYDFTRFILKISDVQPSQQEGPTMFLVTVPQHVAGFPASHFSTPIRRTALEDLLIRKVSAQLDALAHFDSRGMAVKQMQVVDSAPQILPRSALSINDDSVEMCIQVQLPALNDKVDGEGIRNIFFEQLPDLVDHALVCCNLPREELDAAVALMDETDQIRQILPTQGLVALVAEGSSVVDGDAGKRRPISIHENAATTVEVPEYGRVTGLGVTAGITLVLGTEQQGRRALMRAVADGIYNHCPGDGRERCVTVPDAVYVAAHAGRSVQHVDLSAFMAGGGAVSTASADAFTSQAASVMEALTAGARVLLFDEADSAPGFLTGDERLARLLPGSDGRIPLAKRAREIVDSLGVSLVVGGAYSVADMIPAADTILAIRDGVVVDITQQAREQFGGALQPAPSIDLPALVDKVRWIVPSSVDPSIGVHDALTHSHSATRLQFGRSVIDLSDIFQIADRSQTETIGLILEYAKYRYMEQPRPLREVLDLVDRDLSTEGLECLTRDLRSDLARPRRYEIAAALNRLSTLRITDAPE